MSASDHLSAGQAKNHLHPEDFEALARIADPGFSVKAFGPHPEWPSMPDARR